MMLSMTRWHDWLNSVGCAHLYLAQLYVQFLAQLDLGELLISLLAHDECMVHVCKHRLGMV